MTPEGSGETRYRIYIQDGNTRFYLRDWIACDDNDHLVFDVDRRYAMRFKRWHTVKWYQRKMVAMGYTPFVDEYLDCPGKQVFPGR